MATRVAPSRCLFLSTSSVTPTSIALQWTAPVIGSRPFRYTVMVRPHGQSGWRIGASSSVTHATVTGLLPSHSYDFEIVASNVGAI